MEILQQSRKVGMETFSSKQSPDQALVCLPCSYTAVKLLKPTRNSSFHESVTNSLSHEEWSYTSSEKKKKKDRNKTKCEMGKMWPNAYGISPEFGMAPQIPSYSSALHTSAHLHYTAHPSLPLPDPSMPCGSQGRCQPSWSLVQKALLLFCFCLTWGFSILQNYLYRETCLATFTKSSAIYCPKAFMLDKAIRNTNFYKQM